jgi:DNA-binding HxlR family transcriptional regulator
MERRSFAAAPCPVARSLDVVGEWWSLLIVREALMGVTRFDRFQTRLGISRNALAQRLKKLVAAGIMEHRKPDYGLTEKGRDLATVVLSLRQWGDRWLFEPGYRPLPLRTSDGEDVKVAVVTATGRTVDPAEIQLGRRAAKAT